MLVSDLKVGGCGGWCVCVGGGGGGGGHAPDP